MYVTRRRVCERGKREGTGRHDSCLHRSTRGRPLHVLQLLGETLACLPQVPYLTYLYRHTVLHARAFHMRIT